MQKPEELVRKIKLEEHELNTNLDRLEYFMMSEDFTKISKEQKTLLEQQHKAMTEYKLILIKRAHRINWEAGRDKAAAKIMEATKDTSCATCKWNQPVQANGMTLNNCTNRKRMMNPETCWEPKEPVSTDPNESGCMDCKHAIINNGKPQCTKAQADGKTCWESTGPQIREYR